MTEESSSEAPSKGGWFRRLREGLSKSSTKLVSGIGALFTKKRLDAATIEELEDLLITGDLGVATAAKLTANLAREKFDKEVTEEEVREAFAADIAQILDPVARPLVIDPTNKPHVCSWSASMAAARRQPWANSPANSVTKAAQ